MDDGYVPWHGRGSSTNSVAIHGYVRRSASQNRIVCKILPVWRGFKADVDGSFPSLKAGLMSFTFLDAL